MREVTLIVDYRRAFYSSTPNARTLGSMDVERLASCFRERRIALRILEFADVDLSQDWRGSVVLYQSSEDPDLQYKSYIEDTVLALCLVGAVVVPRFEYLRAHHNKVFMEYLRQVRRVDGDSPLGSRAFGTLEEFLRREVEYPTVLKAAAGAGSRGVTLVRDRREAANEARRLSFSNPFSSWTAKELVKRIVRRGYVPHSLHRRKFVAQRFVANLDHDYKVLVYGRRVFVVRRGVRHDDFRASGSGKLSWPTEPPAGLLDYAWTASQRLGVPFVSLDVAHDGAGYHLIEFQCLCFGPAALERSTRHWQRDAQGWSCVEGASELERVFAEAVDDHLRQARDSSPSPPHGALIGDSLVPGSNSHGRCS